jgi:transposase
MTHKKATKDIMNVVPNEEQGGEAIYGFDYQTHCATRLCLEMLAGHDVTEIICEHHEDVIQMKNGQPPNFYSVKKRESANTWTIALLKDAIRKLFQKLQYKNVGQLVIYGSGRPSQDGECSLAGLIALLDRPDIERDAIWDQDLKQYEDYFMREFDVEFDVSIVRNGLRVLKINLAMPHPEAIEAQNVRLAANVISIVWGVEVTIPIADQAYNTLYKRVWDASHKPKMSRTMKAISREEAVKTIKSILHDGKPLASKPEEILDIQTKLQKGRLEDNIIYALQMRMDAQQVKFEMELKATEWQDFKTDIAVEWEKFNAANSGLDGANLWRQLRQLLHSIGNTWVNEKQNTLVGAAFAEGVFFEMMAVCEAHIGVR